MHRLVVVGGKRVAQEVPFMQDLLFVKDTKEHLDAIVESTPKLQYRYKLGVQHTPIIVPVADMERFIKAVEANYCSRARRGLLLLLRGIARTFAGDGRAPDFVQPFGR